MEIVELSKKEYKGHEIACKYQTKSYFDIKLKEHKNIKIRLKKKKTLFKQEKQFKTILFEDFIEVSDVYGIFDKRKLVAVIQSSLEVWNNRYRIWDLHVEQKYRKKGYGKALIKHIEGIAKKKGARALILEVQSCNEPAITFYRKLGYMFKGFDISAYTNNDIKKREVRLEFGKDIQ